MAELLPHPPAGRYADPATERLYRQQRLAAAFRLFARFGFDEGVAGHITARDPEDPDRFWVNPFGLHFGHISVSDLLLVDAEGDVVAGEGRLNGAAFAIHSQVHAARPDVVAAAHAHSLHGKAWSGLGRLLDPHHPGRLRLLRGPRAVRRLHRRRPRHRGGPAHRPGPRRLQGGHPAQPRPADRRPLGRRGGLVVHHHGAHVPGPAAGRGRRHPGADRAPSTPRRPTARWAPTWPAGSASSPSWTASCASSPTCSTDPDLSPPRAHRRACRVARRRWAPGCGPPGPRRPGEPGCCAGRLGAAAPGSSAASAAIRSSASASASRVWRLSVSVGSTMSASSTMSGK